MSQSAVEVVLQKIPYGIAVVTSGRGGVESALTVSWMSQVSFSPPHLMIAVDRLHYTEELLRTSKNFVVNLLREDQRQLAGHFARESITGEDKVEGLTTRTSPSGATILSDALAWMDCEVTSVQPVGDHLVIIGRIEDAGMLNEGKPLTSASGLRYHKSRATR